MCRVAAGLVFVTFNITLASVSHSRYGEETPREYLVNMVGLPFSATEDDIKQFFHPIRMTQIEFLKNDRGQPRGIAVVGFYSQDDRVNAMLRNKNTIGLLISLVSMLYGNKV